MAAIAARIMGCVLLLLPCVGAAQGQAGPATRPTQLVPGLDFINTGFENASPLQWDKSEAGEINIRLLYDYERNSTNRAAGHWHFQLQGTPGTELTLVLHNFDNIYNGRPGAAVSKKSICFVSNDGQGWKVIPAEFLEGNRLRIRVRLEGGSLYLARIPPYRLSDLARLLDEIREDKRVQISEIGRTVEGRPLEIVRIGNPDAPHRVLLRARSHSWEPGGNWVVQGLIRSLVKNEEISRACLERCCIYILPMANKDGVVRGLTRFNMQGRDLNRNWDRPADTKLAPENHALENWIKTMVERSKAPDLVMDLHNDEGGGLHISRPTVDGLDRHVRRMQLLEQLLRRHTWFTEGSSGPQFRNPGTVGEGLLERYGIDACILEFNCNWIAGLKQPPSAEAWEQFGSDLRRVFIYYFAGAAAADVQVNPFDAPVLRVRPRIFLRDDERFEGLTVQTLRQRVKTSEFQLAAAREKWRSRPQGRAILWLIDRNREDLEAAIAGLRKMDASEGTWSDRGPALVQLAATFDWLYTDLDEATRREVIARIERAADAAISHVREGQAPFFYSRTPGALAGLSVAGLALHGVSDKADSYLKVFRQYGVEEYFKAYDWVDGAATGATYTLNYTFVDLPSICAAWWSATGQNPAGWIAQNQGDWLGDMVQFYLWYMRPGFAFTHINDQFRGDFESHDSFCQGLDIASYVMRDGYGRTWSKRWQARFGPALYHSVYAHNLIFRDTELDARPLTELPLARLFGRDSCGYGFFRSYWPAEGQPDMATHVFFRMGDPMDVHGGVAAGEFQVFRHAPLADRGGRYGNYDSPPDQYHRNAISANVILFTEADKPDDRGDQNTRRGLKNDHATWQQWLEIRQRNGHDVATITEWQVQDGLARCRADLTRANAQSKCRLWEREFVWLGGKHLVVLDVVETARPGIRHTWQLHLPNAPEINDRVLNVTSRPPQSKWADESLRPKDAEGRLFCQTLLPRAYTLVLNSAGRAQSYDVEGRSQGDAPGSPHHRAYGKHVVEVDPGGQRTRTVFLHVLTAQDASQGMVPKASCRLVRPGLVAVTVDGASVELKVPEWFSE